MTRLEELVAKVREKTATPAELEEIARAHFGLARTIARNYAGEKVRLLDVLVADAMFGIAQALNRAPEALYDDEITPYIITYMKKYVREALHNESLTPIPYSTLKRHEKKGTALHAPAFTNQLEHLAAPFHNLQQLEEAIDASIRQDFEREVIELRKLGLCDQDIAEKLGVSRDRVNRAKLAVLERFKQWQSG